MKHILTGIFAFVCALLFVPQAHASHTWGGYHWARTANPFTLKAGDNLTAPWKPFLATTSADWSLSTVLDVAIVAGKTKGNCQGTSGQVEVCNKAYGNNGWLGIAQVWVSGLHITKGTTKVNDTYFNTSSYNTPAWKNLVLCQEVGHTLGLNHQDENFNNGNLNTCMDYTNNPATNQHPNVHDYDQLSAIYAHLDTTTTVSQTIAQQAQDNGDWGRMISQTGHTAVFEKDLGLGNKLFTFVIFAQ